MPYTKTPDYAYGKESTGVLSENKALFENENRANKNKVLIYHGMCKYKYMYTE